VSPARPPNPDGPAVAGHSLRRSRNLETLLLKNINETMGLLGVEPLNSETDD